MESLTNLEDNLQGRHSDVYQNALLVPIYFVVHWTSFSRTCSMCEFGEETRNSQLRKTLYTFTTQKDVNLETAISQLVVTSIMLNAT